MTRRHRRRREAVNRGQQIGGGHHDPREVPLREIAHLVLLHSVGVQHPPSNQWCFPRRPGTRHPLCGDRCAGDRDRDCLIATGAVVHEHDVGAVPEHDLLNYQVLRALRAAAAAASRSAVVREVGTDLVLDAVSLALGGLPVVQRRVARETADHHLLPRVG